MNYLLPVVHCSILHVLIVFPSSVIQAFVLAVDDLFPD